MGSQACRNVRVHFVKSLPSSAPPDVSSMLAQPLISELWDPAFVFVLLQLQKGFAFLCKVAGRKFFPQEEKPTGTW